jgi:hypothetical protein
LKNVKGYQVLGLELCQMVGSLMQNQILVNSGCFLVALHAPIGKKTVEDEEAKLQAAAPKIKLLLHCNIVPVFEMVKITFFFLS